MEEIDIKEILYFIWKKKIYVILLTIVAIILGAIYTMFFVTPMYSSTTTLVLSKPTNSNELSYTSNEGITQNDITLNSKLISTYSEIMKSRSVAEEIKNKLNLDISEESLMKNISVSEKNETEMLVIKVSNEDPVIASNVANTLSEVFAEKVTEIYNIENVTVIDKAIPANSPNNINLLKNVGLFGAVGLVMSCGILFLIFYFDNTIKSKHEVEELLGLDILAIVPELKN